MAKTDPKTLLKHGLHLGHKKNKVHPQAQEYVHSFEKGTSIIDLIQTAELLDEAKSYAEKLGKENKTLLCVATKKVAREPVTEKCSSENVPYMTNKWVGGFLTNFNEISKNIEKMNRMREEERTDAWSELPKHEQVQLEKELNKITSVYGGVQDLEELPDALFIIDIRKEANAMKETVLSDIPSIAVVDTNVDPREVEYPIPANDDAISSITYITNEIIDAYAKGKKSAKKAAKKAEKKNESEAKKTEEKKGKKKSSKSKTKEASSDEKKKASKRKSTKKKTKTKKSSKKSSKKTKKS